MRSWLGPQAKRSERLLRAYERGLVDTRACVLPIEEVFQPRGFEEKNDIYMRAAADLGEKAVRRALDAAHIRADEVDFFVATSCTGFMIPSVDAVIAHRLGMKNSLSRLPITQHGCAGGVVALRQAQEHLLAHPEHTVLVLAVEIPSVTFQHEDFSPANIISASLFGDGAAAVVLRADGPADLPRILATDSRLFPDSLDLMGFQLRDSGLKIVLSKRVPEAIREHAPTALRDFLGRNGLDDSDIRHFLLHPGGRKIVEGFESTFGLGEGGLDLTRSVLREHGNLSSATVLFVLDAMQRSGRARTNDMGILVAFGPGFGCETLLLGWGVRAPVCRQAPVAETVGA